MRPTCNASAKEREAFSRHKRSTTACASAKGASREVFRLAPINDWELITTPYVIDEVSNNLGNFPSDATAQWAKLRRDLKLFDDVVTLDRPAIFPPGKDRPIIFSALAWSEVLLTLDQGDFAGVLGHTFYDLAVLRPGVFLQRERAAGRLKTDT